MKFPYAKIMSLLHDTFVLFMTYGYISCMNGFLGMSVSRKHALQYHQMRQKMNFKVLTLSIYWYW